MPYGLNGFIPVNVLEELALEYDACWGVPTFVSDGVLFRDLEFKGDRGIEDEGGFALNVEVNLLCGCA